MARTDGRQQEWSLTAIYKLETVPGERVRWKERLEEDECLCLSERQKKSTKWMCFEVAKKGEILIQHKTEGEKYEKRERVSVCERERESECVWVR